MPKAVAIVEETGGPVVTALGGGLEGAERTSRETMLWNADRRSPDQLINTVKLEADARGRDVVTNDGYAQGVMDIYRDSIVGNQYRLNAQPNWVVLSQINKSLDEVWANEFQEAVEERFNLIADSNRCWLDASRTQTFTGLIRLAIAGFVYTGEVLGTAEWIRDTDRPFNTAYQLISPTRLSNPDGRFDDALLRNGIVRNQFGRQMGYYVRKAYPSEFFQNADVFSWAYVPAEKPWGRKMVIHIKDPFEAGQTRGLSSLVAVLKDMKMTKKFKDVTLQNAVINASYAATVESELPSDVVAAAMGAGSAGDATQAFLNFIGQFLSSQRDFLSNSSTISVDGAKIPHLFPGTKLNAQKLGTPGGVGTEFEVSLLRHIAAGLGISYEELARDFSRTNYSSARASMLTTFKHMMARKKFVADRQADEIYGLWLEEDLNTGNLPLPRGLGPSIFYENGALSLGFEALRVADWIGAARGQIDEMKETQAALLRINGRLSTREIEIARMGGDWRKVMRQLAREQEYAASYDLSLDMPAAPTVSSPGAQPAASAETSQDEADNRESADQKDGTDTANQHDEMKTLFSGMTEALAAQQPPTVSVHIAGESRPRKVVTTVTKHDAEGRILETIREELPDE